MDPLNPQTVEDLRFALGQDIHVLIAPDYQISERINELYGLSLIHICERMEL